jgi:vacuolar-type H+-ATPase subunit H
MVEDRTRSRALDDQTLKASVDASRKALDDKQRLDREALADKEREEVAALAAQTARDVAALAARRAREDEDRAFRQAQQVAAQEFSDGLENEALARQITRIQDDTRTRIEGINTALTDKQRQITEDAATEARKVGESAQERIGILKDKFFDKVGPLADDAKNKINLYIGDVQKRVGELQAAAVAAAAAVASVGGGGSDNGVASGLSNALTSLVTTTRNAGSFDRGVNGRGGYASGGRSIPGGLSLVGEQGPELVRLPGGSDVFSNADTGRMLGGGNSDDNRPVNIILDGATIARSTWKHLKRLNLSGATLGLT